MGWPVLRLAFLFTIWKYCLHLHHGYYVSHCNLRILFLSWRCRRVGDIHKRKVTLLFHHPPTRLISSANPCLVDFT